ncbi:MAG: tRNA (adenosine(37)-N6)-dimethylallyltransferase MiaA [Bdellovibrionia bacterium]
MKVVFIVGATASGKSDWALRWAQKHQGVVVNCDSVQVYREVEIGTAKPTLQESSSCPHYLFDYVSPPEEMTAGNYYRDFYKLLPTLQAPVAFVVGGTGFYFQAIEKGLYPVLTVPPEIKLKLEQDFKSLGGEVLWQELKQVDPETASELHPNDSYRVMRALEVWRAFQKPMSAFKKEFAAQAAPFAWPLLKVGPLWEREELRQRISLRTQQMLTKGLLAEVADLKKRGLESWAPLASVGYKECLQVLEKSLAEEELEGAISLATSQLAKRQMTWFKRDPQVQWFAGSTGFAEASKSVEVFLNQ